jgi:glycosyl transferase family 1
LRGGFAQEASMSESRLKTLILALVYPHRASYYDDWRDAFVASRYFDCTVANILDMKPRDLASEAERYDSIIMLHSCNSDTLEYFAPLASVLGERKRARLVSFVGNEFNSPYVSMSRRVQLFRQSRCDFVATQLLVEAGEYLYGASGAKVVAMPHALNPQAFQPGPNSSARKIDLGFKGYRYPPFLGDDDRNQMLRVISANAQRWGIDVDISEDRRLNREDWARFLQSCKGAISTETGSWFIAPDDALIGRIHAYLKDKRKGLVIGNDSFLRRAARRLPMPIKSLLWPILKRGPIRFEVLDDFNTSFEELDAAFFRDAPRAPVYGKAISSRHFDAIGTKTCQLMLRGRYNDILTADEHYIAVDPNFANADGAIARFKDAKLREGIAEAAYRWVMGRHTYSHRTQTMFGHLTAS